MDHLEKLLAANLGKKPIEKGIKMFPTIRNWSVRPSNSPEDYALPYVTSSMVEAVNTCPRWGIINNIQGKRFVLGYRQMALEAGSLMHDVFAVFNLITVATSQKLPDHADYAGRQLFGDRWDGIEFTKLVKKKEGFDLYEELLYSTVQTSDFYDDPKDRNRTVANLEACGIELAVFLEDYDTHIWIEDETDPTSEIGIEKSLDVIFTVEYDNGHTVDIRFIGLADALYQKSDTNIVRLGEFKTTAGMNDGWRESFKTRHQLSAYFGALSAYFEEVSEDIVLTGMSVPVRKTTQPIQRLIYHRDEQHVTNFLATATFAMELIEEYEGANVLKAPMFTHSCNRYFRPCSLMDLCTADSEDIVPVYEQMETVEELSPSEQKAKVRYE